MVLFFGVCRASKNRTCDFPVNRLYCTQRKTFFNFFLHLHNHCNLFLKGREQTHIMYPSLFSLFEHSKIWANLFSNLLNLLFDGQQIIPINFVFCFWNCSSVNRDSHHSSSNLFDHLLFYILIFQRQNSEQFLQKNSSNFLHFPEQYRLQLNLICEIISWYILRVTADFIARS